MSCLPHTRYVVVQRLGTTTADFQLNKTMYPGNDIMAMIKDHGTRRLAKLYETR